MDHNFSKDSLSLSLCGLLLLFQTEKREKMILFSLEAQTVVCVVDRDDECGKCRAGNRRLNLNKFCRRDYGEWAIEKSITQNRVALISRIFDICVTRPLDIFQKYIKKKIPVQFELLILTLIPEPQSFESFKWKNTCNLEKIF